MGVQRYLKENRFTRDFYYYLSNKKKTQRTKNLFKYSGTFENRSKNKENLCIVLAGYKEFLYDSIFGRLESFMEEDIDVCIISSGKYSEKLVGLCKKNDWSYLSTKENNVSLVQNVAISLFPKAKYIYKLDEDIFITKGYFTKLKKAYEHAFLGDYHPGIISPLIPINGFTHMLLLDRLGLIDFYKNKFENPIYMAGPERQIESNPDVAKFFWNEGDVFPTIDKLNKMLENDPIREEACPIRFSIGAIFFERDFWEKMGYFSVNRAWNGLGADEIKLCRACMEFSRPVMVSKNIVVGHLAFGPQNETMRQYYMKHPDVFAIKEV